MGAKRVLVPKGEKEIRPWWGLGLVKRNVPIYDVKWQKSAQTSNFNQIFSPHDYEGNTYEEKRSRAIEDAETNLQFYKELINEKVLPVDTKIKIKRLRHTDAYHLEFYMPNLFDLGGMESLVKSENVGRGKYKRFVDKTIKDMDTKIDIIRKVASRFGYNGSLNEDTGEIRNYGYDSKRELRLHDIHILSDILPNKHRKKRTYGKFWYTSNKWVHETESRNKSSLEHKVEKVSIIILFSLITLVLIDKLSITGNIVSNSTNSTNVNIISILIIGAIIILLLINKLKIK